MPIDEQRVAAYARILEAENRIAVARARAGVSDAELDRALEASELPNPESLSPTDLYVTTIERFVAALGGRLDVAAVFEDMKIDLPQ